MVMTEMEAIRWMAWWVYRPALRPQSIMASPETLFRMADGFADPENSDYSSFAQGMKRAIEERTDRAGPLR